MVEPILCDYLSRVPFPSLAPSPQGCRFALLMSPESFLPHHSYRNLLKQLRVATSSQLSPHISYTPSQPSPPSRGPSGICWPQARAVCISGHRQTEGAGGDHGLHHPGPGQCGLPGGQPGWTHSAYVGPSGVRPEAGGSPCEHAGPGKGCGKAARLRPQLFSPTWTSSAAKFLSCLPPCPNAHLYHRRLALPKLFEPSSLCGCVSGVSLAAPSDQELPDGRTLSFSEFYPTW